jgi:flagellar basal-body rod protein FlgF
VHSGVYTALSGLKAQMTALDTLANNLANVNTTGFKGQESFFTTLNLVSASSQAPELDAALNNPIQVSNALNMAGGPVTETHRDLDLALVGKGFLTVETPAGERYTRNGNLITNAKSELCTSEGHPVLGERGHIVLGQGKVDINQDGEILVNGAPVDRLKLMSFDDPTSLKPEGSSLFASSQSAQASKPATEVSVRQGFLEQSNINPVLATMHMVEIMRQFESLQRCVSLIFNELDAKAIEKLPR